MAESQESELDVLAKQLPPHCFWYDGLSPEEIEEVEAIILDRSNFFSEEKREEIDRILSS